MLFLAAYAVLGAAIDWPASLDLPAAEALPLVHEQRDGVRTGYLLYLASSLLFLPVAVLLPRVLLARDPVGARGSVARLSSYVGAASAVLRGLGIIRWVYAMPALAAAWVVAPAADRGTLEVAYDLLNDYAGAVGEVLGVAITGGAWFVLVGVLCLRGAGALRWLGGLAVVAGVLNALAPVVEPAQIAGGALSQLFALGLGLVLLLRAPR